MSINRFIKMHELDYEKALEEIRSGYKKTHWMWYIFPQIKGLGTSAMADYYAIKNLDEAKEYLNNKLLRSHLLEISEALLYLSTNDPNQIMGFPDSLKLFSSITLFYLAEPDCIILKKVLDKYYNGKLDQNTIKLLKKERY